MNFICNQAAIDLIHKYESLHDGDLSAIGLQTKMCPIGSSGLAEKALFLTIN